MKKLLMLVLFLSMMVIPVYAFDLKAPEVPDSGKNLMPNDTTDIASSFHDLIYKALELIHPNMIAAVKVCSLVLISVLLLSVLTSFSDSISKPATVTGAVVISAILMQSSSTMIQLSAETITELSDYTRMLLPILATAFAAQGNITSSAALYGGTIMFNALLSQIITTLFLPGVHLFLAISFACSAIGESALAKLKDMIKSCISWCLKTLLTVFTTYLTLSGVISGTADAAAIKAARVTISTAVPVVGGILSDASESILISASLIKNAIGIYGIFAILAVFLSPFLKIGVQYILLKLTAAICGLYGPKKISVLIEDFSSAMGLLLGITGAMCILFLISCICFLKGVG